MEVGKKVDLAAARVGTRTAKTKVDLAAATWAHALPRPQTVFFFIYMYGRPVKFSTHRPREGMRVRQLTLLVPVWTR